ncbi:MAG: sulfite exporter TauE/SafE family protein, partial [Bacteroidales bacterium]|nr:sulfite exporter TauE/SafE family protein [Bacteroidales bacterium]
MVSTYFSSVSALQLSIIMVCAMLIGASKTGIKGAGMVAIPIMATFFGGKVSAGLVLPLLLVADSFAVTFYSR